jgi:VWFA-related protein
MLSHRNPSLLCVLILSLAGPTLADRQQPAPESNSAQAHRSDVEEHVETRLLQLDVNVTGPAEIITGLTTEDFELYLGDVVRGGHRAHILSVDSACRAENVYEKSPEPAVSPSLKTTYIFYFDQAHLTMEGRERSLEIARGLIDELVTTDSSAMIVSNGLDIRTFADLTSDRGELYDALERIEKDPRQFSPYSSNLDNQLNWLRHAFRHTPYRHYLQTVKSWQEANIDHATFAFIRLSMLLHTLADLPMPKALFYFGDTICSRPGGHIFGPRAFMDIGPTDRFAAAGVFDEMLSNAGVAGIRIFAIQAGTPLGLPSRSNGAFTATLSSLGKRTGGEYFLYGTSVEKISRKVRKNISCLYVLSIDPTGLPKDERLGIRLLVKKPGVKSATRKQTMARSKSASMESSLLTAFMAPELMQSDITLNGTAIPVAYNDKKYSALVQVQAQASPLPETNWSMGVSLLSAGLSDEASGNVSIDRPGVPIIFEAELDIPPEAFELLMVARETTSSEIGAMRIRGEWPDPDDAPVTVGPIALLQPVDALFLRDDKARTRGALGYPEEQSIRIDRPTSLVSLICRDGSGEAATYMAERRLVGSDAAMFPVTEIMFDGKERCIQMRDLIPEDTMTEGGFIYEIHVLSEGVIMAESERRFTAVDP